MESLTSMVLVAFAAFGGWAIGTYENGKIRRKTIGTWHLVRIGKGPWYQAVNPKNDKIFGEVPHAEEVIKLLEDNPAIVEHMKAQPNMEPFKHEFAIYLRKNGYLKDSA